MRIIKPRQLSLSFRTIEIQRRFGLCVTGYLHVPFAQAEGGSLWGEQSMWNFFATQGLMLLDEGVAKTTAEYLVHGRAFAPPHSPGRCAVRARVGDREKTLLVFGERFWNGSTATDPLPFDDGMPITWDRAYGGPDFPANPIGKGRVADQGMLPLPNIELPDHPIVRPGQAVPPAGFGPINDVLHPQRAQYRGTYDDDYLKQHAPGFAPDIDWKHFNLAPADQWFDAPLQGDETFAFDHLHSEKPRLEGRLPGLKVRSFIELLRDGEKSGLREVPLRLTTAWFFPNDERCILVFHGLTPIATDDASDVGLLMGAIERIGEEKPDEHYAKAVADRDDPRFGGIRSLRDGDLLPDKLDLADPEQITAESAFKLEGFQAQAQRRRAEVDMSVARSKASAMGLDPDKLGMKLPPQATPPSGDKLADFLEAQMQESERQQIKGLEDALDHLIRAMRFAKQNNLNLAELQHRGPPAFSAKAKFAELESRQLLPPTPEAQQKLRGQLAQMEGAERLGYLQGAHMQPAARPMPPEKAAPLKEEMRRARELGLRFFGGLDFTGADFSGLDLSGFDFSGAMLESANLAGANLAGANFSGAVLARVDFTGANAIGASFIAANLGRAKLAQAAFDNADLTGATLSYCDFAQTRFPGAKLAGATLLETTFGPANWQGVSAPGINLLKRDLKGLDLSDADLSGTVFVECDLSGCELRRANLSGANFVQCKLEGTILIGAQAANVVFAKETTLRGADFAGADLSHANLGGIDASGARLHQAKLDGANLSGTTLDNIDGTLASAKGALVRRATLRDAKLGGIDFMDAILQHADLRGADLRRSNLFGADLSRIRLDANVQLDGSLLERARTYPRLSAAEQEATP